jgi:uncharacterized membrane protein YphA (DoxX/SURF4 family)
MLTLAHHMPDDAFRDALAEAARIGIALVWLIAGVQKLRSPASTRATVARLVGGPHAVQRVIARAFPVAEILLGLWVLTGWHGRASGVISALAFVLLAGLLGRAAIRGSIPEGGGCGCFGTQREPQPDDAAPRAIARNLVLAILAVAATA